jgi:hypothetical protein
MFDKEVIPIVGIVENMSYFICDGCGKKHEIFARGAQSSQAVSDPLLLEKFRLRRRFERGATSADLIQNQDPASKRFLEIAAGRGQFHRLERREKVRSPIITT